jgi:uncharacterized protein YbcI
MTADQPQNVTRGQLERTISQQFQKLYRNQLGHATGKVSCRLFDNKLTIIVEDALTQPEQLLLQNGSSQQVEELHSDLAKLVRPRLVDLVETILGLEVIDLMGDTTLETGRTGLVIVLSDRPEIAGSRPNQSSQPPMAEANSIA